MRIRVITDESSDDVGQVVSIEPGNPLYPMFSLGGLKAVMVETTDDHTIRYEAML